MVDGRAASNWGTMGISEHVTPSQKYSLGTQEEQLPRQHPWLGRYNRGASEKSNREASASSHEANARGRSEGAWRGVLTDVVFDVGS